MNTERSNGASHQNPEPAVEVLKQIGTDTQLVRYSNGIEALRGTPLLLRRQLERQLETTPSASESNQVPSLAWEGSA